MLGLSRSRFGAVPGGEDGATRCTCGLPDGQRHHRVQAGTSSAGRDLICRLGGAVAPGQLAAPVLYYFMAFLDNPL